MRRSKVILTIILIVFTAKVQASPVSGLGNGWIFRSLSSARAYLYTPHAMSWAEAEDFCQMVYGHLATDSADAQLRQYLDRAKISGAVWIGLHQSRPQTQFTWTNDFDWSEESMAPGDGWGEYVEEYEAALCVSLDIDHSFRWDTRYCQGVLVAGTVCQIQVPLWVSDGRCSLPEDADRENITLRYYPDQELVQWATEGEQKTKLCSIEDKLEPMNVLNDDCCNNDTLGQELLEKPEVTIKQEDTNQTKTNSKDQLESSPTSNITVLTNIAKLPDYATLPNITMLPNITTLPNNATAGNSIIVLHNETMEAEAGKYTENEDSKEKKITQKEDKYQIDKSKEKLNITVKFELKNNTSIIQPINTTNHDKNRTSNSVENNVTTNTLSKTKKSKFPPALKVSPTVDISMSNSDRLLSLSTSKIFEEESSSSLISFRKPELSTTETVSSAIVPRIFTKYILNRTQQTSDETGRKVSTEKSKFTHLQDVTNVELISTVTPELTNSTVEIPPKVSISTDIFNSSEASTFKESNETWPSLPTEAVTDREPRITEDQASQAETTILSRQKRSSGQRNSQVKNRQKELSRINTKNRQLLLEDNLRTGFNIKGD